MDDFFRTFSRLFLKLDDQGRAREILVIGAWNKSLNGQLAKNVIPVRLEKKKLIAGVRDETWRRNVADLGPEIAGRLNAVLGGNFVEFVEFQVVPGERFDLVRGASDDRIGKDEWSAAQEKLLTDDIREAADSIEDDELREKFLAAAGSSLTRRSFDSDRILNENSTLAH